MMPNCRLGCCRADSRSARSSFLRQGGRAQRRIGDSRPAKAVELHAAAQLLAAKIEWVGLMRIDQDRRDSGASEHRGGGRYPQGRHR
jgi:hypothetical protein